MQIPSVGRIIHYYDTSFGVGTEGPYPAIIVKVHPDDRIDLQVFPIAMHGQRAVEQVLIVATRPESVREFAMWPERV